MTTWRYAAATDTGLVRETNQDSILATERLVVVADGMGGHAAGEVASAITVQVLGRAFAENDTVVGLEEGIEEANQSILADAFDAPEHLGMGTTVICVGLTTDSQGISSPTLFNVGDSRAYQLRDGALRQLSQDHSVAEEWVRMGRLTSEEAAVHPLRHQLTRALGVENGIEIDVQTLDVQPGDRVLLCSDGLSNELSPNQIATLASSPVPLEEAVQQLIARANAAGGRDNISVVLVEFDSVTPTNERAISGVRKVAPKVASPTLPTRSALMATRRSRYTWRTGAFIGACVLVIVGFFAVLQWYARSGYFLADDSGQVAVYQGQPHGILWYKPTKVLDTGFLFSQLRPGDQRALAQTISEPSVAAAVHYATFLYTAWQQTQTGSTTTTTTKTTKG
jgi:protein phosphatase